MKVCFIVSSYEPDTLGGLGEVALKLQRRLLQRSVETYVVTSGMDMVHYPYTMRTKTSKRIFYGAALAYLEWIRRMNFDVINVHLDSGMGIIPLLVASRCRAKIVTTLHTSYLSEWQVIENPAGFRWTHAHPMLDEYIVKYLLTPIKYLGTYIDCASSDRVIAVSKRTAQECKTEYKIPEEKISVIYNGVDTAEFNPLISGTHIRNKYSLLEKPVILVVGTATIRKGVPYLLQSMAEVASKIPNAKLIVVGSKKYLVQLQLLAKDLGILQNVIFPGPVPREELPFYYAACDVVAVPSTYEGFPVVVLEAMASGKPIVASRVGGIPEAVETNSNGILVEPRNPSELTQALITVLENEDLRRDMGEKSRELAEKRFNWERITDEYMSEFKSLL